MNSKENLDVYMCMKSMRLTTSTGYRLIKWNTKVKRKMNNEQKIDLDQIGLKESANKSIFIKFKYVIL